MNSLEDLYMVEATYGRAFLLRLTPDQADCVAHVLKTLDRGDTITKIEAVEDFRPDAKK